MDEDWQETALSVILGGLAGGGAALMTAGGDPGAAVLAGIAAEPAKILLLRTWKHLSRLGEQQARRGGPDALANRLKRQPEAAALLFDAATAMARAYEEKVETIARAVDQAMLYEEDVRFDVEALIVRTIFRLDRPHVAALVELGDDYVDKDQLPSRLPGYAHVLPALLGELDRLGLTEDGPHSDPDYPGISAMGGHKVTGLGREVRQRFQRPTNSGEHHSRESPGWTADLDLGSAVGSTP